MVRQRHERTGRLDQFDRPVSRWPSADAAPMMAGDEIHGRGWTSAVLAAQTVQQVYKQRIAMLDTGEPNWQHGASVPALGRPAAKFKATVGPVTQAMVVTVEIGRMHPALLLREQKENKHSVTGLRRLPSPVRPGDQ